MADVKHTPGPWVFHVNKSNTLFVVRDKEKRIICEMSWHTQSRQFFTLRAESEVNARLIAAAPDLLEALIAAEQALEHAGSHLHADRCREVIAKATGAAA